MSVWNHSRKGRIEGDVVGDDGTFTHIRLTADHHQGAKGDTIMVRKTLLTEVPEAKEAGQ